MPEPLPDGADMGTLADAYISLLYDHKECANKVDAVRDALTGRNGELPNGM